MNYDRWRKELDSLSMDRLRFEDMKRQRELTDLQQQLSLMIYQEGRANDEWEREFEEASVRGTPTGSALIGGYQTAADVLEERQALEDRIKVLEEELAAIQEATNLRQPRSCQEATNLSGQALEGE